MDVGDVQLTNTTAANLYSEACNPLSGLRNLISLDYPRPKSEVRGKPMRFMHTANLSFNIQTYHRFHLYGNIMRFVQMSRARLNWIFILVRVVLAKVWWKP